MRPLFAVLVAVLILCYCSKSALAEQEPTFIVPTSVTLNVDNIQAYTFNKKIGRVQTNAMMAYGLGKLVNSNSESTDYTLYSQLNITPNPIFGSYSQSDEKANNFDEQEVVTKVTLRLPLYSHLTSINATTGDNTYGLDSISGNMDARFNVKIQELTHLLSDLDPSTGFLKPMTYYSNDNFSVGQSLNQNESDSYTLNSVNKELIVYKFDDPTTTDDESKTISKRVPPALAVSLSPAYFQTKILNIEGSDNFSSREKFVNYLKGIKVSVTNPSEALFMLLNFSSTNNPVIIDIDYTYKYKDTKNTTDTSDDVIYDRYATFSIPLSGIVFNNLSKVGANPPINDAQNAARLYMQGGLGYYTEIQLFDESGTKNLDLKRKEYTDNEYLINEAYIIFKIDSDTSSSSMPGASPPPYVYIFNLDDNGMPLRDFAEPFGSLRLFNSKPDNCKLIKSANGDYYKITITRHITDILKNNKANARLGVVLAPSVFPPYAFSYVVIPNSNPQYYLITPLLVKTYEGPNYDTSTERRIPWFSNVNRYGAVFYGGNESLPDDKRTYLQIIYTKN